MKFTSRFGWQRKLNRNTLPGAIRFWNGVVFYREKRWAEAYSEFQKARGPDAENDAPLATLSAPAGAAGVAFGGSAVG